MKFDTNLFSYLVSHARKDRMLSLRDLEREIGIDHSTLSRIERGKYSIKSIPYVPDVVTLYTISQWLGYSMESFFTSK